MSSAPRPTGASWASFEPQQCALLLLSANQKVVVWMIQSKLMHKNGR